MKRSDYIQVIKKYKQEILQCSALAVTVVCACAMSYMAGRYSGRLNVPAAGSSEGGAVETTSQYIDLAPGSPFSFRQVLPAGMQLPPMRT